MFSLKKFRFYLYVLSPQYNCFVDSCRTTIWMTSCSDFTLGLLRFETRLLEPFCRLTCMQNSRKRTTLYWTEDSIDSHWRHKGAWPFVHRYSCLSRPQLISWYCTQDQWIGLIGELIGQWTGPKIWEEVQVMLLFRLVLYPLALIALTYSAYV